MEDKNQDPDQDKSIEDSRRPDDDKAGRRIVLPSDKDLMQEIDPTDPAEEAAAIGDALEEAAETAMPSEDPSEDEAAAPEDSPGVVDGDTEVATQGLAEDVEESTADGVQPEEEAEDADGIREELTEVADEAIPPPGVPSGGKAQAFNSDDFGTTLEKFIEAGGIGGGGGGDYGGDSPDDDNGLTQFAGSVVGHAHKQDDMLIEHARMLDDMVRRLELERL